MSVILITGGARSGKSNYAQEVCKSLDLNICYIATAKPIDTDMEDRIAKHKASRPSDWTTIEKYNAFKELEDDERFINHTTFLLDCITIMVTNIMFDYDIDYDTCSIDVIDEIEQKVLKEVEALIYVMKSNNKNIVIVTNEVGNGVVPPYRLGNIFRDFAGRINQYIARQADEVYNVVCGLEQRLK